MAAEKFKTVEDFLSDGRYLKRTDVVLCSSKKNIFSRLIRYGTRSPYCHAAMVFLVPKHDAGFNNTFIIEAGTHGVDITDLRHYLIDEAGGYQVAIKRLETDWYQSEEGGKLQKLVRGNMLDYIKAEYDYLTIWRITKSILRRMIYGFNFMRGRNLSMMLQSKMWVPNEFICSGFVQYGFWQTMKRLADADPAQEGRLDEIDFAASRSDADRLTAILATTPEDLARTEKLAWKYLCSHGQVWKVDSYEDAKSVILGQEG